MVFEREDYQKALEFFKEKDIKIYNIMLDVGYVRPPTGRNLFATLIGTILGQRVSYRVSRKQRGELYKLLGTDNFDIYQLKNNLVNLSRIVTDNRYNAIENLINYLISNKIDLTHTSQLDQLKIIIGIGDWTINCTKIMYSISMESSFVDHLLYEDLIIKRAIKTLYSISKKKDVSLLSNNWSPWRGIVTWYMWKKFS